MSDDPLAQLDAWEQANQVRRGELTAAELVEAAIRRIEALDPRMNSVIARMYDEARAAAESPDLPEGRFRGVPFLMKDLGATQAGQPYYLGNRALRDIGHRAEHDTYLGARFRRALAPETKAKPEMEMLSYLFNAGRSETEKWLARAKGDVGKRDTVDLARTFLTPRPAPVTPESEEPPPEAAA